MFGADRPGRSLNVLRLHYSNNISSGNAQPGHPQRVQPDAHGIFARSHDFRRRNAIDPTDGILDIGIDIVVQFHQTHPGTVGQKGEHSQQVVVAFFHRDPVFGHIRRQIHFRAVNCVLLIDHCNIRIRSALERDPA